jgi:hypothetical protein
MKEFVLIFRNSRDNEKQLSPQQMQDILNSWMNWVEDISAQNKLADKGNGLNLTNAKVVKPNGIVTDGPYKEIKEFINGYLILMASTVDEAVEVAKRCPILSAGGNVEVRTAATLDD